MKAASHRILPVHFMLELIGKRLDDAGIAYALLTGDTIDRAAQVMSFQMKNACLLHKL